MVDFIEEVEEQLRSDRYRSFALKSAPWFAALLATVIVVWLAVWGYNVWRDRNIAAASVTYDKALTELAQGDQTGAYNDFAPIAASGPAGYKTLSLMQQGNIRLAVGKNADAAALFDQAAKAAPNDILRDLSRLRAALALMDTAPYPQLQTRLAAIIGDKKPFDLQAREALAMAKLAAGKTAEARGDFNALNITLGASQALRVRAQAAIALIDSGEVSAALAAAKTAATLPPPKPGTLGGSASAASGPDTPSSQGAAAPQDQGEAGTPQ
ncbi:MAG TPA: tetratricopeptide repeat protein [Caulobacteraceae bacterium]